MSSQIKNQSEKPVILWPQANSLILKLSHFVSFSESDRAVLESLCGREECFPSDMDIISEGMAPRSVFLLTEGLAIRYRSMPDGGRQIMTFLIPGDLCGLHGFLLKSMDHSIGTITPVRIAPISRESMIDTLASRPRISAALLWSSLQEEAMLRERIVSLGRRDARGRIAYLLCELLWRHAAVGLTDKFSFRLPLTQTELGDTLGLTPVHVNHVLQDFRARRLISLDRRLITLLDVTALQSIAAFTMDYLQLGGASEELIRYLDELESPQKRAFSGSENSNRPCADRYSLIDLGQPSAKPAPSAPAGTDQARRMGEHSVTTRTSPTLARRPD